MSAEEHRAHAAEEQHQAREHASRYDPNAQGARLETSAGDITLSPDGYNPTHWQREAAEGHERVAEKHLAAARELERSEDAACAGIPPAARGACPLIAPRTVEDVERGVRITFASVEGAERAASVIRCQQAFARTRAYQDLPSCILYARDLHVAQNGTAIVLTSPDSKTLAQLSANVRAHAPAGH
jgi:hypothetical protein